jgi:PAS domain S-box-containing protein
MKAIKKSKPKPKKPSVDKIGDIKKLVQLLQIHQVELEHQNQELRIAQQELEASRNKYVNLFDFAPVPYFSLNSDGIIKEVNLRAAKMFKIDRNKLVGKRFISFVSLNDRDVFNLFMHTVFNSHVKSSCELKVMNEDKRIFNIRMEGIELDDALQIERYCQIALIDLTQYLNSIDSSL